MARRPAVTRKQIVEALVSLGAELGRSPSKIEFLGKADIMPYHLQKYFKGWNDALCAAKLRPNVVRASDANELLDDWGLITRSLGHCPKLSEYCPRGKFGSSTFRRLFQSWPGVPNAFYSRSVADPKWLDVITIIREKGPTLEPEETTPELYCAPTTIAYGDPIDFAFLRNAPVNEAGVVYLFGCLACRLGFTVEAIQTQFPDCEAKRKGEDGKLRRVRIEFEFESRNFELHGHDVKGCDVIVCWKHNWEGCPIDVVELSKHLSAPEKVAA